MNNPLWVIKKIVTKYSNRPPYIKLLIDKLLNYSKWNKLSSSSDSLLVLSATQLSEPDSAKLKPRPLLNRLHAIAPSLLAPSAVVPQFSASEPTTHSHTASMQLKDLPSRPSPTLPPLRPPSPRTANAQSRAPNLPLLETSASTTLLPEPSKLEKKYFTKPLEAHQLQPMVLDTSKLHATSRMSTELPPAHPTETAPQHASKATPPPSADSEQQRPLPLMQHLSERS